MASPLHAMTSYVRAAQRGEWVEPLREIYPGEMGELEKAIVRLVEELRCTRREKVQKESIDRELKISRAIQNSLLPSSIPEIQGLETAALYRPAQEVGGDYYDFIEIDSNHTGIAIADVSGKSISGAMLMTIARNTLRSQAMLTLSPREVLERTHSLLLSSMMPGFFVSMYYIVLEKSTHRIACANAGHLPLLLFRAKDRRCEWVRPRGVALGLMRNGGFGDSLGEIELALEEGDLGFLYTDGVTEAVDPQGGRFGRDRIAETARASQGRSAFDFLEALESDLLEFIGDQPQEDDVTAVVFRRETGNPDG